MNYLSEQMIMKFPDKQLNMRSKTNLEPQGSQESLHRKSTKEILAKPALENIKVFGVQDNVNLLLLNQRELDFRETIKEIINDYPSIRKQKNLLHLSELNQSHLAAGQSSRTPLPLTPDLIRSKMSAHKLVEDEKINNKTSALASLEPSVSPRQSKSPAGRYTRSQSKLELPREGSTSPGGLDIRECKRTRQQRDRGIGIKRVSNQVLVKDSKNAEGISTKIYMNSKIDGALGETIVP